MMLGGCSVPHLLGLVLSALPCASTVLIRQRIVRYPQPSRAQGFCQIFFRRASLLRGLDILSQEGFVKMKEIVSDILAQSENMNV
jgi:hypothetical protein